MEMTPMSGNEEAQTQMMVLGVQQVYNQQPLSCSSGEPVNCTGYDTSPLTIGDISKLLYLVLLCVVGVFGNVLVICTIIMKRAVYKNANIFIMNLAIADLVVTGIIVPIMMANVVYRGNVLDTTWCNLPCGVLCDICAFLITTTCIASIANVTVLAGNRYLAITHNTKYQEIVTNRRLRIVACSVWVWATIIALSPKYRNWGRYSYEENVFLCYWDDDFSQSQSLFQAIIAGILPLLTVLCFYAAIFINVRATQKDVISTMDKGSRSRYNEDLCSMNVKLVKMLAVTTICLFICWGPFSIQALHVIPKEYIKPTFKLLAGWLGITNSVVNFIIYGLMNSFFRKGYKELLFRRIPQLVGCTKPLALNIHSRHDSKASLYTRSYFMTNTPSPTSRRSGFFSLRNTPSPGNRRSMTPNIDRSLPEHMQHYKKNPGLSPLIRQQSSFNKNNNSIKLILNK